MAELDKILSDKIAKLQAGNLVRQTRNAERADAAIITINGKKLLSFSCNDYLGMSQERAVIKASKSAAAKYGTSAGASRLVTGNNPLYEKLEKILADICGAETAVVYGSGYMANIGAITALVDEKDLIITDKLAHSCIIEGAKLSEAAFKRFPHNNHALLEAMLEKYRNDYRNCLVITESVFSMDGDSPDLRKLQAICNKYNCWLMIDYAHDLNHLISDNNELKPENLIVMGTLSKAVGSYGGYIAGSKILTTYLKSVSKTLIFTTGLPPGILAASTKSLEIIKKEQWRIEKALENAKYFKEMIAKNLAELEIGNSNSQIVPLIIGGIEDTIKLSEYLYENGFLVSAIRPPTVPVNTSRLRFSFSAMHEKNDIDMLVKLLIKYYKKRGK